MNFKDILIKDKLEVGKILIAKPFIQHDSYYKRSTILLGEYGEEGSVGFILNKPTDLSVNDALLDFPNIDADLYFGGPIQTDTIHFIHNISTLEGRKRLLDGVYWGGNIEQLMEMIECNQHYPYRIKFFAGYTGWEPEQLENEGKMWIVGEGRKEFILAYQPENMWKFGLQKVGSNYAVMAEFPEDPSLN